MLSHHDYTSNPFNPSQGVRLFPISLSASIVSWHKHNLIICGFSACHKCKPQVLTWWRTGEGAGGTLACRWCCGLFASIALLPYSQWHAGPTQLLGILYTLTVPLLSCQHDEQIIWTLPNNHIPCMVVAFRSHLSILG